MGVKLKPGDVLELSRPEGFLYVQFVGTHPWLGEGILVGPRLQQSRPVIEPGLFDGGYIVFYLASLAVTRQEAAVVASLPTTGLPSSVRTARDWEPDGRVRTWAIESPGGVVVKETLTEDEIGYPIASILSDSVLVDRVLAGWHPSRES
jgi:hypothetical protein